MENLLQYGRGPSTNSVPVDNNTGIETENLLQYGNLGVVPSTLTDADEKRKDKNFVNLVNRGRPADFTLAMLPAIYSSDDAFRIFIETAAEDPRLIEGLETIPTEAEINNSDLLR